MMNRRKLYWCTHYHQCCQLKCETCYTRKYLTGLGNHYSSATYNQEQLNVGAAAKTFRCPESEI